MSKQLDCNKELIHFLLSNKNKVQSIAVLRTLNISQTKCISEIVYNFLRGHFEVDSDTRNKFKKRITVLREIGSPRVTLSSRRKYIASKPKIILKLLLTLKEDIVEIL